MKNFIKLGSFLLLLTICASSYAQDIQTGTFSVDKNFPEFNLNQNVGARSFVYEVKFKTPFKEKPEIMLSVTSVDANAKAGLRYKLESAFITNEGFAIKFATWGDSKLYGIQGSWLAIEK